MMTINIAYLVHTFEMGGIERCVARLASNLDRETFQPMVVCLNRSGAAARWIEREDVEIVELRKRPRSDFGMVRRLARVLRDRKIDVVHSHNWGTLVETTLARRWAGVPVHVHTEHGQGLHEGLHGPKRWVRRQARRWAFERVDQVLACADSVRPLIAAQCGFPEERIRFLPNGVDPPQVNGFATRDVRAMLGLDNRACIVGSVGRLAAVKNFGIAIRAIAELAARGVNVHLVLVGDGPEEGALRSLIRELSLTDRIHLVGRHEDVSGWLQSFDVYVNCSRSEAMSLGILEAMAAHCPMVVSNVGDNSMLVDGRAPCGLVVQTGDPADLARAIEWLLGDADLRGQFRENAASRYRDHYSTERMVENHAQLYEKLLHRTRPTRREFQSVEATVPA